MLRVQKVARHAGHGRFVTAAYARFPWLTVVETMLIRPSTPTPAQAVIHKQ